MNDVAYSPLQERAIDEIVKWYGDPSAPQEFYLAGYAGTGKTTVVKEAMNRLRHSYGIHRIPIGAYTGKAAFLLRKKGNVSAQTIHSMIYLPKEKITEKVMSDGSIHLHKELVFELNPLGEAALADLITLDECSMIDNNMAADLRSFGKKILVMGDPGQLPPINGEGSFTSRKPDFFLEEIHRQAADSPIIELATLARQGILPPVGYKKGDVSVSWLSNDSQEAIFNPDTQVLCGVNRVRHAVTQMMRHRLHFKESIPMAGEKILCCKNNKQQGLFNGGAGFLTKIDILDQKRWRISCEIEGNFHKNLTVDPYLFHRHFDGGMAKPNFRTTPNEFDWGYIWSVHKAQGSSWPHVTLIDNSSSFRENRWKHLYTAITRAETGLTLLMGA